jgi:hypothetical protein
MMVRMQLHNNEFCSAKQGRQFKPFEFSSCTFQACNIIVIMLEYNNIFKSQNKESENETTQKEHAEI